MPESEIRSAELIGNGALYLDRQLCFSLYACSRAMTKAYQPMLSELGITYPQYLVLLVLWECRDTKCDQVSVKELGERLRLDSGTLTPLLKRMEAAKLLCRSRDSVDERRVLVGLTVKGLDLRSLAQAFRSENVPFDGAEVARLSALRQELLWLLKVLPH
jgi:DNA-binding MarR family transcriptional regulator